ncbi:hypothetical protein DITRI_Ditri17bG0105700 [Diplodiscus trichospermus]
MASLISTTDLALGSFCFVGCRILCLGGEGIEVSIDLAEHYLLGSSWCVTVAGSLLNNTSPSSPICLTEGQCYFLTSEKLFVLDAWTLHRPGWWQDGGHSSTLFMEFMVVNHDCLVQ